MRPLAASLLVFALACAQQDLDPATRASRLYKEGRFAEAKAACQQALSATPGDPMVLANLLACQVALKEHVDAIETVKKYRDAGKDPFEPSPVRDLLEKLLNDVGANADLDVRIRVLTTFQEEFPGNLWRDSVDGMIVGAYASKKDEAKAEEYEKRLFDRPEVPAVRYLSVGLAYLQADARLARALECLEKGVELFEREEVSEAKEIHDANLSMYRSYLAYAYARNGVFDPSQNRLMAEESGETPRFEEKTGTCGLGGVRASRVAAGDFDGDGFDDLVFQGTLFRNDGKWGFENVVERVGLAGVTGAGCLWADYDNDGRLDLLVTGCPQSRLMRQGEGGEFADVTKSAGLAVDLPSTPEGAAWFDADGDGWLDLYLACYEVPSEPWGRPNRDFFFHAKGHGTFEEVTSKAGFLDVNPACGRGVACCDYDNDGDTDVFVANYRLNPDFLFQNAGGLRFANVANEVGVAGRESRGFYGHGVGATWGDLDNDGRFDLVVGNLAHPRFIEFSDRTKLFHNLGGAFEDVFARSGIAYEETHSDVSCADMDNDGDLDLYFTSVYRERPSFLYRNDGGLRFARVTWHSGALVFNGWGHAWSDLDNDGDLDLVVASGDGVRAFRNTLAHEGEGHRAWLQLVLRSDKTVVGARVTAKAGDRVQVREANGGRGTTSQDTQVLHFGLGVYEGVVDLEVRWPDGRTQAVPGVQTGQRIVVENE